MSLARRFFSLTFRTREQPCPQGPATAAMDSRLLCIAPAPGLLKCLLESPADSHRGVSGQVTMSDFIQRFHFQDSAVRGEVVQLDQSLAAVLERHDYPERVRQLLGELMAASVLLASTLKFEGCLILQARGDGPLDTLMAECNHLGEVRAIAQLGDSWSDAAATLPLRQLLGEGQLAITIDPEEGQRYQGIVPLDGDLLAECIEHYFDQSEQLPTRLWLASGDGLAGGMLLQVLPGGDRDGDADTWPRLQQLTDTVRPEELMELPADELLYRLYHEENVELFPATDVAFQCSCSRERTEQVLVSLGHEELETLLEEQGRIAVSCQFCNQEYVFDRIDVAQMLRGGSGRAPSLH